MNENIRKERFTFGKYKDKMIANVMITDKEYILWLATDEFRFRLSDYWRKRIEQFKLENGNTSYATYVR